MANRNLILENVEILPGGFRNFSGRPGQYNAEGDRNFCVVLPEDLVPMMESDGWNIKTLPARDEGDQDKHFIRVKVRFNSNRPPKIVLISSGGKSILDEESVDILDWSDILSADMAINPYESDVRGEHHVTGYLKSLYVTLDEDDLEKKYADVRYNDLPNFEPPEDETPF